MPGEHFRFGEFELDGGAYELRRAGRSIHLERIPFELLCLLVERRGQVVTRGEIVESIWGKDVYLDAESAVSTAIRKIRRALDDNPEAPRFVATVPAKGYRFVADVHRPEPIPQNETPKTGATAVASPAPAAPHEASKRIRILLISAAVLVAAIGIVAFLRFRSAPALTEKDTIVLADFANSTGDPVFDDTLKQALSVQLSQSPFLSILSDRGISGTLQMMGHPADERVDEKTALEVCQRTQSAAVLNGSIAILGRQYVIGLNAIDCRKGDFLAQEQVRADSKEEVLKALDHAATQLRAKLGESLSSLQQFDTPIAQATTPSLGALQAYSLGRKTLRANGDFAGSIPFFQRAVRLDPNFAMAYAELASSYADLQESGLAINNIQKAYELRERTTDREKYYIEIEFYDDVTGDLNKSIEACKLWEQTYPRDLEPHFTLGNIYDLLGRYDEGLAEARESVRLDPGEALSGAYLVFSFAAVNQLEQARITAEEIQSKKLDSPSLHITLYPLAFARNDSLGMAREVAWAAGKVGVEDVLIADEASTAAYYGQLHRARDLSRSAIKSADQTGERETVAGYRADAALREALFGNPERSEEWSSVALSGSEDPIVQFVAVLATAVDGDATRAQTLAAGLQERFPQNTIMRFNFLPTIQAQLALRRGNPSRAIESLQAAAPYELGQAGAGGFGVALYPVYVRGEAYLQAGRSHDAAVEFQKILDHRSIVTYEAIGSLAHLGLARAYAMQGDTAKAKAAYQDFLTLWKDADPDIPILKQAKAEYAKLK
ncbi:MAG TPA: winged helix-turn-helix domain-containing protein [Candidatus Limnocylindrales bacterium]|nr:winged helix-turn-helix domain-containing protein [Candidatus Limnocylindrales bacterium]